ncbi:MAG: TonB-dependent receptor [Paludibacter sp.]|nr:TonB-dependent receptor [Paludibacter sp.]
MKHTNFKQILRMLFTVIVMFVVSTNLSAQQTSVSGVIKDAGNGEPIIGANILEKGTTNGTITNFDGQFTITTSSKAILEIKYVGYETIEVSVAGKNNLVIQMKEDAIALGEVVAIGYGVQKKTDKTGAVANVKAEDLGQGVLTDAIQGLQGKAAGVLITKKGGDPNAGFSVKIRGASGFEAGTQPLYVIDGMPGVDPTTVAPEDIESYNILKDAASTAIYGSRGSNGVIIITTKKGSSTANGQVQFNTNISTEQVANKLDFLTAADIRKYVTDKNLPGFIDGGSSTDWQSEIFRPGFTQSYNLSFSGGNAKSNYYASVTNANWEGIMKGTSKERTIGKVNISHKGLNDKLTLTGSISGTFEKNDYESYNGFDKGDIIYHAYSRNPTDPIFDETGAFHQSQREFNYSNPLAVISEIQNQRDAKRFYANLRADLEITKGLTLTANSGYTRDDNESFYFQPRESWITSTKGLGSRTYGNNSNKLFEGTLTYVKAFGEHNFNLLGGYSYQETNYDGFSASGRDAYSDYTQSNRLQALLDVKSGDVSSNRGSSKLIGMFGRAQYNFASKYYASASLRRDGSSRFGDNNKWGYFPTAAIGWNIDRESFMESIDWVDQLKLRGSYGVSGNQEIGDYRSKIMYYTSGTGISVETGEKVITFSPAWNPNPDLKWEQTSEVNIGIDFSVLNSRINGSLEVYYKRTNDLLGGYAVPVPPNLASRTFANSGSMENKGIELNVQFAAVNTKNFKWKTSITASHNQQQMLDLGAYAPADGVRKEGYLSGRGLIGDQNWVTGVIKGQPLGSFYLPVYVTMKEGKFIYKSMSGGFTDQLALAKREIVGSAAPIAEIGWANNLTFFKNWTLDLSFRSMIGNDVYNATKMFFDNPNNLPSLNALPEALVWAEKGRTDGPKISSYYVEDGSFIRLDYIALGYNFDTSKINKWIKNARVSVSANNLFVLTGYTGIDPETSVDGMSFGIDQYNVYPKTRSVSVGLNLTF